MRSQVAEAATEADGDQKKFSNYTYPAMTKTQGSFRLQVEAGEFTDSEIIVMLGENGTGTVPCSCHMCILDSWSCRCGHFLDMRRSCLA